MWEVLRAQTSNVCLRSRYSLHNNHHTSVARSITVTMVQTGGLAHSPRCREPRHSTTAPRRHHTDPPPGHRTGRSPRPSCGARCCRRYFQRLPLGSVPAAAPGPPAAAGFPPCSQDRVPCVSMFWRTLQGLRTERCRPTMNLRTPCNQANYCAEVWQHYHRAT